MQFEKSIEIVKQQALFDNAGHRYEVFKNGHVSFGDIARNLLDEQCQYASRYINGELSGYPALGRNLRFSGLDDAGGNYHSIGIGLEDVDEFRHRYEGYKAYKRGFVTDNAGEMYGLDGGALETLRLYLESFAEVEPTTE